MIKAVATFSKWLAPELILGLEDTILNTAKVTEKRQHLRAKVAWPIFFWKATEELYVGKR